MRRDSPATCQVPVSSNHFVIAQPLPDLLFFVSRVLKKSVIVEDQSGRSGRASLFQSGAGRRARHTARLSSPTHLPPSLSRHTLFRSFLPGKSYPVLLIYKKNDWLTVFSNQILIKNTNLINNNNYFINFEVHFSSEWFRESRRQIFRPR